MKGALAASISVVSGMTADHYSHDGHTHELRWRADKGIGAHRRERQAERNEMQPAGSLGETRDAVQPTAHGSWEHSETTSAQ